MNTAPDRDQVRLDLDDIQANLLRGYRAARARHHCLALGDAAAGARFLAGLLPEASESVPHISTATIWDEKPPYCMNLGITFAGLKALGLPDCLLRLFPPRFQLGPAGPKKVLEAMGDTGDSDPRHWLVGGPSTPEVHLLISIFTHSSSLKLLDALSRRLLEHGSAHGLKLLHQHDAEALPEGREHFGFRDGIAQPRIKGVPAGARETQDMQPLCEPGEFLLGCDYVNQFRGNFLGDLPGDIGDNASYGAFRIMEQDVGAFNAALQRIGRRIDEDPEWVAAKMMGRWRNGDPLTLCPAGQTDATRKVPEERINAFDYAPTPAHPNYYDDSQGLRCPIGSHIRRMNPRGSLVLGLPNTRRVIRRAMPYGKPMTESGEATDEARGLVGYFICGDLEMQFEFLMANWANGDLATSGIRNTRDPIIGAQDPDGGSFTIRTMDNRDPIRINDLTRFVTTRGSLYCLLPGMKGLRFLASLAGDRG